MKPQTITYLDIHPCFKINDNSFTKKELLKWASYLLSEKEDFKKEIGIFIQEWCNEKEYVIVQTSGTTGNPKKIKIKKQAMVNSAIATGMFFNLQPKNTALLCLPARYIAGKLMLVRSFVLGLHLYIENPSEVHYIDKKYHFGAMVPMQVEKCINSIENIKTLLIGGAKINTFLTEKLTTKKNKIYETFGMTETVTHIAAKKIGEEWFSVLPNITVTTNTNNCLVINAPLLTKKEIVTNDMVIVKNNKFKWLGRIDFIINSGGIKIIPERIEKQLEAKINHRFFIFGKKDEKLGEKVVLYIESTPYKIDTTYLFDDLKGYEKPKEIIFVPKFEETTTQKIKKYNY